MRSASSPSAAVIDVGGGSSRLVDELVARGFTDLTVLDVSPAALDIARRRLDHPDRVTWLRDGHPHLDTDAPMGPVARPRRLPLPHRSRRPRHLPPPSRRSARAGRCVHRRHVRRRRPRPLLRPPCQPLQPARTRRHHHRRHPRRQDQHHLQRGPRHTVGNRTALHLDRWDNGLTKSTESAWAPELAEPGSRHNERRGPLPRSVRRLRRQRFWCGKCSATRTRWCRSRSTSP